VLLASCFLASRLKSRCPAADRKHTPLVYQNSVALLASYEHVYSHEAAQKRQTRQRAIAKALHLEGHSDFAPDVVGFSGLFGLKILFSDVF